MPAFFLPLLGFYNAIPNWLKKLIATVAIGVAIFVAGDIRGRRIEHAKCEEKARLAQNAANAQDLEAERQGRAQDLEITNALTQQKKVDDERIEKLQQELSKANSKCLYDKSNADPEPSSRRLR